MQASGKVPALCWGLMPTPSAKEKMQHYFKIRNIMYDKQEKSFADHHMLYANKQRT